MGRRRPLKSGVTRVFSNSRRRPCAGAPPESFSGGSPVFSAATVAPSGPGKDSRDGGEPDFGTKQRRVDRGRKRRGYDHCLGERRYTERGLRRRADYAAGADDSATGSAARGYPGCPGRVRHPGRATGVDDFIINSTTDVVQNPASQTQDTLTSSVSYMLPSGWRLYCSPEPRPCRRPGMPVMTR